MSFLDPDRFHTAARDGHLDLLQEANRKELNSRDEDGMTPAMWASYYGRLDALRLIVGRGGDPDKCDHYGNTCLHCAAGSGHADCVSFLVHFGVNLWALDNDFHTAKDVAVLNRRDGLLSLLDRAQSRHALLNKRLVQRLKEKSVCDAEKRVKNYRKLQMKAAKRAEKEEQQRLKDGSSNRISAFRRDSRFLYAPKFSDIVHAGSDKRDTVTSSRKSTGTNHNRKCVVFRPGDVIERRGADGEVLFTARSCDDDDDDERLAVTSHDGEDGAKTPAGDEHSSVGSDASSDAPQTADSGIGDEMVHDSSQGSSPSGIFERPGFGTLRHGVAHLASSASSLTTAAADDVLTELQRFGKHMGGQPRSDSIGSASSLARRHISWEDECDSGGDERDGDSSDGDEATEPLSLFLTAVGLAEYIPLFQAEKIDLESLSLLSEEDLKVLCMPLGPRRKLGKALQQRCKILEDPGVVQDSRL